MPTRLRAQMSRRRSVRESRKLTPPDLELLPDGDSGEYLAQALGMANPTQEQLAQKIPKFRRPENINIIVAGGTLGNSHGVRGWVSSVVQRRPANRGGI